MPTCMQLAETRGAKALSQQVASTATENGPCSLAELTRASGVDLGVAQLRPGSAGGSGRRVAADQQPRRGIRWQEVETDGRGRGAFLPSFTDFPQVEPLETTPSGS